MWSFSSLKATLRALTGRISRESIGAFATIEGKSLKVSGDCRSEGYLESRAVGELSINKAMIGAAVLGALSFFVLWDIGYMCAMLYNNVLFYGTGCRPGGIE